MRGLRGRGKAVAAAWLATLVGVGIAAGGAGAEDLVPVIAGPASSGLVVVRKQGGNPDLWRVRISDGAARRLFHTPDRGESRPMWSQATRTLLYQFWIGNEQQLVVWDADTGDETPVYIERPKHNLWGALSPDGRHVAYSFQGPQSARRRGIGEYDVETGERRVLAKARNKRDIFRPVYAPDSTHVAAQFRADGSDAQQLWLLRRKAFPRRLTTTETRQDTDPVFTRDSEWVIFSHKATGEGANMSKIRLDGSDRVGVHRAHRAGDESPATSPTRDELVFVSSREGGPDLFLASLEGDEAPVNLTNMPSYRKWLPRWSPDGELVALSIYSRHDRGGNAVDETGGRILVVDRKGNVLLDTPGKMAEWMPAWE